jgi:hypothetical protein
LAHRSTYSAGTPRGSAVRIERLLRRFDILAGERHLARFLGDLLQGLVLAPGEQPVRVAFLAGVAPVRDGLRERLERRSYLGCDRRLPFGNVRLALHWETPP